jgi:hypothetical protein
MQGRFHCVFIGRPGKAPTRGVAPSLQFSRNAAPEEVITKAILKSDAVGNYGSFRILYMTKEGIRLGHGNLGKWSSLSHPTRRYWFLI